MFEERRRRQRTKRIESLESQLLYGNRSQFVAAFTALVEMADPEAIDVIDRQIDKLLLKWRKATLEVLSGIPDAAITIGLLAHIMRSRIPEAPGHFPFQEKAAWMLAEHGKSGHGEAVAALARQLEDADPDWGTLPGRKVASVLRCAGPQGVDAVLAALESPREYVRRTAFYELSFSYTVAN